MRLNGWHRLWVLVSFLALVVGALILAAWWPDETSVPHSIAFYDALTPSARSQIAENESGSRKAYACPTATSST